MSENFTVLEYLYRDAGNYKAWGQILLSGQAAATDEAMLRECLDGGEFFVAEQVGIPALYEELQLLSGGSTCDDHAFHEFHALRPATKEEVLTLPVWGKLDQLRAAFIQARNRWNCALSPNAWN